MRKQSNSSSKNCKTNRKSRIKSSTSNYRTKDWDKDRDDKMFNKMEKRFDKEHPSSNDPKWYSANPELVRDAASIPFSWSTGTVVNQNRTGDAVGSSDFVVPGIMVFATNPSIGYSQKASDPANVAATAVYTYVRHANSGSSNYNATDLMLYLLAMSQVYSAINWLQRAYGEATLYSQRNRYLPAGLLTAEGLDAVDVQQHLADFRYGINVLINKAASFSVPKDMTIFARHAFLYQNIYTEGTSIKDQLYMFCPNTFWQYNEDGANGGQLTPTRTRVGAYINLWTVTQAINFVSSLLNPLIESEDMNIMSGDILKAYGADNCIKLTMLNESYPIVPIFDIAVLEQMKNCTVVRQVGSGVTVNQNPASNILRCSPVVSLQMSSVPSATSASHQLFASYNEANILTTTTDEVSPDLVMESTRLMVAAVNGTPEVAGSNVVLDIYTGTEYVSAVYVVTMDMGTGTPIEAGISSGKVTIIGPASFTNEQTIVATLFNASMFDFAPAIRFSLEPSSGNPTLTNPIIDIDNYALIDSQTLGRIHEAAILNEFAVPFINKLN